MPRERRGILLYHPRMDPPAPSILQRYLLEQPWPVVVVLLLVAGGCLLAMRRRLDPGVRRRWLVASGVAAALAGGVYLLAWAVRTDREALEAATRELVAAAGPVDVDRMDQLILPEAAIIGPDGSLWRRWSESSGALRAGARVAGMDQSPHTLRSLRVGVLPTGEGVSLMDVRTDVPGSLFFKSQWRLTWREGADGHWRMQEARWLKLQGVTPTPTMLP